MAGPLTIRNGKQSENVDKFVCTILYCGMATTVRISPHSHILLGELSRVTGSPMTEILDAALEGYRRQRLLDQANAAYEVLATDAAAWDSYRQEVESLDATASDGLKKLKV